MPLFLGPLLFLGCGIAVVLMWIFWLLQLRVKNAALADCGLALGVVLLAGLDAWVGDGLVVRKGFALAMATLGGLRLFFYLLSTRVLGRQEETRYLALRKKWGKDQNQNFLYGFQLRALLSIVFSFPFLLACLNREDHLTLLEKTAAELWLLALVGGFLAWFQYAQFKGNKSNRRKTCREGFWNYSRHPDYFFEFLLWCANALFAFSSPWGYWALICPALFLFFSFRINGIPAREAEALRTEGGDYRRYQKDTNSFVPWLKS